MVAALATQMAMNRTAIEGPAGREAGMNSPAYRTRLTLGSLALAVVCGATLRLDQFSGQLLIDDEWHAVHKLLAIGGAKEIIHSFGYADYSVPLTLLYWLESSWFGLSELAMRWPMMVCGLLTLVLFPLHVMRVLGRREAVVFAWLLALSPMLVNYSRTARPYAITLLLAYLAYWAFYEYLRKPGNVKCGMISGSCMVLAAWLHPVILFFLVAPFLVEGIEALRAEPLERWRRIRRLLLLGLPVAGSILALLLPTLLSDPAAVARKMGTHGIELDTLIGAWHLWAGASSPAVAMLFLLLATLGWKRLWCMGQPVRAAVAGLVLTLGTILLTRPDWIQLPIVLARYLLPFLPLLLLVAVGSVALVAGIQRRLPRIGEGLAGAMLVIPVLAQAAQSPLWQALRYPNNETLHSYFQFDYRPGKNLFAQWMEAIPLSPIWASLSASPRGSLRIAAAPWQFESYHWAGPRWERMSGQHVVPGLLSGLCVDSRLGEYPRGSRIALKNMVFLSDPEALRAKGIGLIVFQKPFEHTIAGRRSVVGGDLANCGIALEKRYGSPVYEDAVVVVYAPTGSTSLRLRKPAGVGTRDKVGR
jgi:hypothetical protein